MKSLTVAARAEARTAGGVGHRPWSECSCEKETASYQLSSAWLVQSEDNLERVGYVYVPSPTFTLIGGLSRRRRPPFPTPRLFGLYPKRQSPVRSPGRDRHSTLSVCPKRPTSSAATGSPSSARIRPSLTGNSLKAWASRTCAQLCVLGCKTIRTAAGCLCLPTKRSHATFALDVSEIRKGVVQRRHTWHDRSKVAGPSGSPGPAPRARRLTKAAGVIFAAVVFSFPTMLASASTVPLRTMSTTNWSGYGLAGSGFTGVTGTFNVPAPHKSTSCLEDTAIWVGVDGLHNHDLLQAGIAETGFTRTAPPDWPSAGFSGLVCTGRVQVYAWWEDLPSGAERVDLPIHVGDSVTVSIFKMSPGWWASPFMTSRPSRASCWPKPTLGPRRRWNGWSRHLRSWGSQGTRSPLTRCTSAI